MWLHTKRPRRNEADGRRTTNDDADCGWLQWFMTPMVQQSAARAKGRYMQLHSSLKLLLYQRTAM